MKAFQTVAQTLASLDRILVRDWEIPKNKKLGSLKFKNSINHYVLANDIGKERTWQEVNKKSWLLDSGSTIHVTNKLEDLNNIQDINVEVKSGNNTTSTATKMGEVFLTDPITSSRLKLKKVMYIPSFSKKIISAGALLNNYTTLTANKDSCQLKHEQNGANFQFVKNKENNMFYITPSESVFNVEEFEEEVNTIKEKPVKRIDINDFHDIMGHLGKRALKRLAQHIGVVLTGRLKPCMGCCKAKAMAKPVKHHTNTKATKPGERLFVDISGPLPPTPMGNKYWVQIVDDKTSYGFIGFVKEKSQIIKVVNKYTDLLKRKGHTPKFMRMDNAPENITHLTTFCSDNNIQMEFTAPNTPKQNGRVERRIAVLRQMAQAAMTSAKLSRAGRKLLWTECLNTMNTLYNLAPHPKRELIPYTAMMGETSKLYPHLKQFGRSCFVTKRGKIQKKWEDKSEPCIFVGYAEDHAPDTYRLLKTKTSRIILSRDVQWGEWNKPKPVVVSPLIKQEEKEAEDQEAQWSFLSDSDDSEKFKPAQDLTLDDTPEEDDNQEIPQVRRRFRNRTLDIEMKDHPHSTPLKDNDSGNTISARTRGSYQEAGRTRLNNCIEVEEVENNIYLVFATHLVSDVGEPNDFWEAASSEEKEQWMKASYDECINFIKRKAWQKVLRDTVRRLKRKIIPVKWVYKKKQEQDGSTRFKGRIVVKGFHQIPGVDYTESFSPVANDSTIKVFFLIVLSQNNWIAIMSDIEAAFLEADLDVPVFVEWPEGMEKLGLLTKKEREETCIKLDRAMYGTIDAPLRFYKTLRKHLVEVMKLTISQTEPCMFYKHKEGKLVLMVVTFVDDLLIGGTPEEVKWCQENLKKRFNVTDLGIVKKHLGVWYEWKVDNQGNKFIEASMHKMVEQIIKDYEKKVGGLPRDYTTPGIPGKTLSKLPEGENIVNHQEYMSLVGKIMYLTTKLLPELSNASRELARHMTKPGKEHWKALERVVGYLKHKGEELIFTYRKPKEIRIVSCVDSSYAANRDDRRSISGWITTLGGCITGWASKTQNVVTLSSTEAEYVALTACAQEVAFLQSMTKELFGQAKQAVIFEDNEGAIFLAKNQQVGQRTKHIDVRHHYIRDLLSEGKVVLGKIPTDENISDINTKNTPQAIHTKHSETMRNGKLKIWEHYKEVISNLVKDWTKGQD